VADPGWNSLAPKFPAPSFSHKISGMRKYLWPVLLVAGVLCFTGVQAGIIEAIIPAAVPVANKTGTGSRFATSTAAGTAGNGASWTAAGDVGDAGGIPGTTASAFGVNSPLMPNATFINACPQSGTHKCELDSSTEHDLYTVPANRKALIVDLYFNDNNSSCNQVLSQVKISGSYFAYDFVTSVPGDTSTWNTDFNAPMLFLAGESLAIVRPGTGNGCRFMAHLIEFDASSPINRVLVTSFAVGNNTVFTAPSSSIEFYGMPSNSGSSLLVTGVGGGGSNQNGINWYYNNTGGARTVQMYMVPSGAVADNGYQMFGLGGGGAQTVSDKLAAFGLNYGMQAGDTVIVNTDSSAAGQLFAATYIQH
jgi:hypothetical protein